MFKGVAVLFVFFGFTGSLSGILNALRVHSFLGVCRVFRVLRSSGFWVLRWRLTQAPAGLGV